MKKEIIIAVCDDLDNDRKTLVDMLNEYLTKNKLTAEIKTFSSAEEFLHSDTSVYSLVFFDIYMGAMSGVEAARELKKNHPESVVIFTTTSREHGADAFDLDAFYYLLKPINTDKLFTVLNRWYDALCEVRTITLKCGRTTREVFVRDILYIEVLGRCCTVHTAVEVIEIASSLSSAEELLPSGEFIHPIRYCLAALRHIASVGEDTLVLSNGEKLPVTRRERDNIRNQLASYRLKALRRR